MNIKELFEKIRESLATTQSSYRMRNTAPPLNRHVTLKGWQRENRRKKNRWAR